VNKKITAADRGKIEILLLNCTPKQVATVIGVHKSTIYREIRKGLDENGKYSSETAQEYTEKKKLNSVFQPKIDTCIELKNYVINGLRKGWSPEEIAGRSKYENQEFSICAESIYVWIYNQKECWYQYLRCGKKHRTKVKGRKSKKLHIPNRVSIHKRNANGFGHFEGDSVIFKDKKVITTFNERMSGFAVFVKQERRFAVQTGASQIQVLQKYSGIVKTLTLDNGLEHVAHESVTAITQVAIYFADPYSSWQRGANENTNGLLRGYLPKRSSIEKLSQEELDEIATDLNNRPRKRLEYRTPAEVFQQLTKLTEVCRNQF
jgi:IS30 family transposase